VRILSICGSLQAKSRNRELLETAATLAPPGVQFVHFDGLRALPHFDPDLEINGQLASVQVWRNEIATSDGLLIACPEYGHSLPGSLKNGIDWLIGSGELERKLVAITASVPGPERGRLGLKALRDTLAAVSARVIGGEPISRGPDFERELARLMRTLIEEVRAGARD
jgi:chromate reductase